MKTIKKLGLVLSLAIATILSSCSKDSNGGSSLAIPATGSYINAKIDGADFTTVIAGQSAATAVRNDNAGMTSILIGGSSVNMSDMTNSKTISLSLNGITAAGTYTLNSTNTESVLLYTIMNTTTQAQATYTTSECTGANGTVTISSISATKIEGTFSFTGKDDACTGTKTITNGTFRGVFQ